MNIIDHSDGEILEVAHPMWDDLIKYSNKGQYGKFIRNFSYDLLLGLNRGENLVVVVVTHSDVLAARFEHRFELRDGKLLSHR